MFSQASVILSTGGGHAWWVGGRVWQGAYMAGGMCGGGYAWQGACVVGASLADLGGARPVCAPPFAWHPSSLADLGGCTRCVPPHLPGILVFDDILGHIV